MVWCASHVTLPAEPFWRGGVVIHAMATVAAIPFLWVLPLSIYLLTFILCFEGEGWYRRNPYLQLLAVALGSMAYTLNDTLDKNTDLKLPLAGNVHIPAVLGRVGSG